jgi:hypothetical protein
VTGDSYTHYFQLCVKKGTGIDALLAQKNEPPGCEYLLRGRDDAAGQGPRAKCRALDRARVVVWIVSSTIVGYNELRDLPKFLVPAKEVK